MMRPFTKAGVSRWSRALISFSLRWTVQTASTIPVATSEAAQLMDGWLMGFCMAQGATQRFSIQCQVSFGGTPSLKMEPGGFGPTAAPGFCAAKRLGQGRCDLFRRQFPQRRGVGRETRTARLGEMEGGSKPCLAVSSPLHHPTRAWFRRSTWQGQSGSREQLVGSAGRACGAHR